MDHQPYALWSIWRELAYSYRLFIFILGGVSIYSLFLAIRTMLGLRAITSLGGDVTTARGSLEALSNRFANVFFIFLVLHLIQWFVWCRLGSFRNVLDTHRPS